MDTLERNQVGLILEHLCSETLRQTEHDQKALRADHSAKGCLRSGATIKRAVLIIEDRGAEYVKQAINQVSAVAQDVDAFAMIVQQLTAMFRGFESYLQTALRLAASGPSAKLAGEQLFLDARTRVFKQLEIHRFSFVRPTKGDLAAKGFRFGKEAATPMQAFEKRNRGGKPLAAHWDAMWAAIAVKLWIGELQPKTQADLKTAMFDWFNEAEVDVGDTALTQRARQLWQAMQNTDS